MPNKSKTYLKCCFYIRYFQLLPFKFIGVVDLSFVLAKFETTQPPEASFSLQFPC